MPMSISMDIGTFMICSFGTVLLLGDHTLSKIMSVVKGSLLTLLTTLLILQNKKTVIEKAFSLTYGWFSHLSEFICESRIRYPLF